MFISYGNPIQMSTDIIDILLEDSCIIEQMMKNKAAWMIEPDMTISCLKILNLISPALYFSR